MRDFKRSMRLRALSLHARIVYSTFLVFTLTGVGLSLWLAHEMVGLRLDRFGEYYRGESPASAAVPTSTVKSAADPSAGDELGDADGPALELPPEATAPPAPEPMATRKLLEVTHFHLFSMPVYLLILAHLYVLGSSRPWAKSAWVGIATVSTAAHILAPWLGAAGTGGASAIYALSGSGLVLSYGWMSLVSLVEMWRNGDDRSGSLRPPAPSEPPKED